MSLRATLILSSETPPSTSRTWPLPDSCVSCARVSSCRTAATVKSQLQSLPLSSAFSPQVIINKWNSVIIIIIIIVIIMNPETLDVVPFPQASR